jgi:5-aminolevulinate synthase
MIDYKKHFIKNLEQIKGEKRYREFIDIARIAGDFPYAHSYKTDRKIVVWCSNDYLAMAQNPVITKAAIKAIGEYGVGSGGTRNISGNNHEIVELEKEVAKLHGKDRGLVFTSGYIANQAAISTIASLLTDCVILSDEYNHASIIAGIRHSKAKKIIFKHNDLADLTEKLESLPLDTPKLLICESVYSMDGSIAPLKEICDLADKYNVLTYVDEVHAVGLYGENGGGISQQEGVSERLDIIQGTFAKAYGTIGGYIVASAEIIDTVRSCSADFIFTTSLPPVIAASARASIKYLKKSNKERERFFKNVKSLQQLLRKNNMQAITEDSHIISLLVGDSGKCKKIADILLEKHDIYIQPINFPTVPRGKERLRITVSPEHSQEMIEALVASLKDVWY